MNKFISATGFDPRRDLTELLVASNDPNGKAQRRWIAKGRFDVSRIQEFARGEGQFTTYAGATVLTGKGNDSHGWMAIADSSTALAGDADSVRAALDRRQSAAIGLDPKLIAKIADLSNKYDAWMVSSSLARLADDMRDPNLGGAMKGNLMGSMENVMGGVRFGANVEVMAEAQMRSEKDATALVDVVKFLSGMMQLNFRTISARRSSPRCSTRWN
jgi:hypothetical protein